MNKKGSLSDVKRILLIVFIGFLLIVGMIYFFGGLSDNGSKAACKNWVNIRASAKPAGIQVASIKSPCITSENIIKKNDDKDKIYEKLARDMYDCWDMYGRGKIDFLSDWDPWMSDTKCMVCSEIKIDEKNEIKIIDIDEFEEYLSQNNPPNHGESYAEFFLGAEHTKVDFGSGEIPLEHSIPLYTVFVANKKREGFQLSGEEKVMAAGVCWNSAQIGFFIGSFFPGGSVIGLVGGCLVGFVGASVVSVTAHADVLYPSMFLIPGKELIDKGCGKDTYYNPKNKLFEGFGGGSSGGAGAGGQTQ